MAKKLIALDTETTGLNVEFDRVISIGAVEIKDRKHLVNELEMYIYPGDDVKISRDSHAVHKLSKGFLQKYPAFDAQVDRLLEYVRGARVLLHNAEFDAAMLDNEVRRLMGQGYRLQLFSEVCEIVDTADYARKKYRGQVNLDVLARKFNLNASERTYSHGALSDAVLLARVYSAMTFEQRGLDLPEMDDTAEEKKDLSRNEALYQQLPVLRATDAEIREHERIMGLINRKK